MFVLILNDMVIVLGCLLGSFLKKHIRRDVVDGVMAGIGVSIIFVGINGVSLETGALVFLFACVLGCFIGYGLDLEGKLERASEKIEGRFGGSDHHLIGPGMNFFIVSCSGAYTINACFFAGTGDYTMLYTKIGLDLVVSLAMSSGLGIGVMFSIVPMTIYQGLLILLSSLLAPLMTESMILAFATTGSFVAILVGTNMIGATKLKVINFLPAVFLAPVMVPLVDALPL